MFRWCWRALDAWMGQIPPSLNPPAPHVSEMWFFSSQEDPPLDPLPGPFTHSSGSAQLFLHSSLGAPATSSFAGVASRVGGQGACTPIIWDTRQDLRTLLKDPPYAVGVALKRKKKNQCCLKCYGFHKSDSKPWRWGMKTSGSNLLGTSNFIF